VEVKTSIYHRFDCSKAEGLCVVIDVLRAFTTAAFAFAKGAQEIILVSSIDEAKQQHQKDLTLMLMGEEEGRLIEGFHFGNSPAEMQNASVSGRRMVQRTSSGTQGVIACKHAEQMLVSSFVVAEATLKRIQQLNPSHVSFIVTGRTNGDEDLALAEYLQARVLKQDSAVDPFLSRVRNSPAANRMLSDSDYEFAKQDLEHAVHLDRFSFAMEVFKHEGDMVARQVVV